MKKTILAILLVLITALQAAAVLKEQDMEKALSEAHQPHLNDFTFALSTDH